jgi:hypothetical protein
MSKGYVQIQFFILVLFLIAFALYVVNWVRAGIALGIIAFIVEVAAWIIWITAKNEKPL